MKKNNILTKKFIKNGICLLYTLRDIYGDKSYHKHIETDEQFRYVFPSDSPEFRLGGKNYMIITITGVRSGVAFYTVEGHPEKEFFCPIRSVMAAFLEPLYLDDFFQELIEKVKQKDNNPNYLSFE